MPLRKKDQQIRRVTIGHGKYVHEIIKYEIIKGDKWVNGYDERASDNIEQMKLKSGVYIASFYPVGDSIYYYPDSITRLKVVPEKSEKSAKKK